LRKLVPFTGLCAFFLLLGFAHAQQLDVAVGAGTTLSSSYSSSSQAYPLQSEKGGTYPSFSAGVILKHRIGFNGEVFWKASQGIYNGYQPFRPIFYDFNAVYQPRLSKKVGLDLMAGIGGESIRFYQNYYTCSYFGGCTNYTSSNHFMGHVGGGIRYYVWGHFFVRPEAHLYMIHNNFEFSSGNVARVGASIGYTLGPE
jgi:hypothetical protein